MTHMVISKNIMLVNPKTGRKIKLNGPTYQKLLVAGDIAPVTDVQVYCPLANSIYNHPDVYKIILSFATSTLSLVKTLKRVNKKTNTMLNSLISDQQLVNLTYKEMRKNLAKKYNLFTRIFTNGQFNKRFMKNLFLLYPFEMMECLTLGWKWTKYPILMTDKCNKFSKKTRISNRYEILQHVYRYILSLCKIPKALMDLDSDTPLAIEHWPNVSNLTGFSRDNRQVKLYTIDKQERNNSSGLIFTQLPSLVQDNVIFLVDMTFTPMEPKDLSFLMQYID